MEGLLNFANTPEGQGLLSAAFSGMAAAGRGGPVNTLGAAGLGGLIGYSKGLDKQASREKDKFQAGLLKRLSGGGEGGGGQNITTSDIRAATIMNPALGSALQKQYEYANPNEMKGGSLYTLPGQAPRYIPKLDNGMTMDANGNPVFAGNYSDIRAKHEGGVTGAQEKEKARYDLLPPNATPRVNGVIRPMTRLDVVGGGRPLAAPKPAQAARALPQGTEQQRLASIIQNGSQNKMPPNSMAQLDAQVRQRGMYYPTPEDQAAAASDAKATGEATQRLKDVEAMLPRLKVVAQELSDLGKVATYTVAGQARDSLYRQMGWDVGEGAIARKEYISKVDNEILPLLRQTFGAQFTEKEGEALKATLGDKDASPAEKDAVLNSFIETKIGQIEGLRRRTGQQPAAQQSPTANPSVDDLLKKYGG